MARAPELDFGSAANSFLVLASADVKGFHYDANAMLNELIEGRVRPAGGSAKAYRSRIVLGASSRFRGNAGASRSLSCAATPSATCGP